MISLRRNYRRPDSDQDEPFEAVPARAIRLLVVEDHDLFRGFVCSTLRSRADYQVVGEVSDGLEAVRKAVELQPDVIVLDIGLPTQSGFKTAQQIRRLCPRTRILFLSQESDAGVIEEAFRVGGHAYVVKALAARELLNAVEEVRRGGTFVTKGASGSVVMLPETHQAITRRHEAHFHSDSESCVAGFASFIEHALDSGKAVIVNATPSHHRSLRLTLQQHGVDIDAVAAKGRFVPLDVAETLAAFVAGERLDETRFLKLANELIEATARAVMGDRARVAACGEGASVLWNEGKADAAVRLEQLWDDIARADGLEIHCGYLLHGLERQQEDIYERICAEHSVTY